MRKLFTILVMAALNLAPAYTNASVNISIQVVQYPVLQRIPGYPVYYAPRLHANYFFYDGLYWVYVDDAWYTSPWFDGPWDVVAIDTVPLFVLRIPVRYYRYPPVIFRSWAIDAPPRWDRVWGPDWAHRHSNWQRWNRTAAPAPAPLPRYQQRFTRANYPTDEQRRELAQQHYRYKPHDAQARQTWQNHVGDRTPRRPPDQAHIARQSEPQYVRPAPRAHSKPDRQSPPHDAPVARYERPPERVEAPLNEAAQRRGHADVREFARNTEPRHEGRPDKPNKPGKPDKEEGHDSGKHH